MGDEINLAIIPISSPSRGGIKEILRVQQKIWDRDSFVKGKLQYNFNWECHVKRRPFV